MMIASTPAYSHAFPRLVSGKTPGKHFDSELQTPLYKVIAQLRAKVVMSIKR